MKRHLTLLTFASFFFSSIVFANTNTPLFYSSGLTDDFQYETERFADLRILRYQVPGFESLDLEQKKLAYYLYRAGLAGRDIMYDQNYKHNLTIRRTLEEIVKFYEGDRTTPQFKKFMTYTKRVWFSNGIHHHYSNDKIMPEIGFNTFKKFAMSSPGATFPTLPGETLDDFLNRLRLVMFHPLVDAKKVNRKQGVDIVAQSAVNFYEGVTAEEVDTFYNNLVDPTDEKPISWGLNSKLVKIDGVVQEQTWKLGGMYSNAIKEMIFWLNKATTVAENNQQKKALELLIKYYETGDLSVFDAYNIAWVNDTNSMIDIIHGFIEVYNDPKGKRGSYEAVLELVDSVASQRMKKLSEEAQWFETHSPTLPEHKKDKVVGIIARAVNVIVGAGDASPASPIGINLPNSNWIRVNHGSKSVNLSNIVNAYNGASSGSGVLKEFAFSQEEIEREHKYGVIADILHTDLHEVIGHASGKIEPGVGTPSQTIKQYASALEEGRADIFALYFILDPKLVELGLMPSLDVGKTAYDQYIRNGLLLQLRRIELGDHIEEAHMQNRQFISKWVYEKGRQDNVIEKKVKRGKTYFVINDYQRLRSLFGELLREIQRIKSQGDFEAAQRLVEDYGTKVDPKLHKEVLNRFSHLNIAPYSGFLNPKLTAKHGENGEIIDVTIEYPDNFTQQMLEYAEQHSFLPNYN